MVGALERTVSFYDTNCSYDTAALISKLHESKVAAVIHLTHTNDLV